ncbi:MAG: hypothetical protein HDR88_04860 [Bacteroides sp.]|nr:hypothetical protein [Bacteroides sp.]
MTLKNNLILIVFSLLFSLPMLAAKKKEITPQQKMANEIMENTEKYIFGRGISEDPEEAYNAALHDMVRQISLTVQGSTHSEMTGGFASDGTDLSSEQFKSVLDSYTTPVSLEGVQVITLQSEPEFEQFVYMPRANIEKMIQRRRTNVADLARNGVGARDKGKVDDALRYLYRSYVLLQSLPAPSEVIEFVDGEYRKLDTWIPDAMGDIMSKISFGIASVNKDEDNPDMQSVELNVKYNGQPATTCTFKYGTGSGYSPLITARDGMALMELPSDVPMNPLKLYVEYQFKSENHVNAELRPILETFKGAGLVQNQYVLNDKSKGLKVDKKESKEFQEQVAAGAKEGLRPLDRIESGMYEEPMQRIIKAISTNNYTGIDDLFTPDGKKVFDKLIRYGKVRILGKATRDTYAFYPFRDEVMCRSIPMSFSFNKSNRQFTEDVTFTFNKDGKIESVGFGLGSIARKDIFAKQGAAWTDDKKLVIVNFLENYRTAFALKELDYIESIFDDDAVIIVGHITKKLEKVTGSGDGMGFATREQVTYAQKSKSEYMEQLRRCFNSQEYINVRFTDTDVERSGIGGETYAIQLKQDYVSQTYGDQGYLFLFIDFNDIDKPLIHIRTWQPERNPDLTPNLPPNHPRAGIFSPATF